MLLEVVDCKTVPELLGNLSSWSGSHSLEKFIFRGHSSDDYVLVPNALRPENKRILYHFAHTGMPTGDKSEVGTMQTIAELAVLRRFYRVADRMGLSLPPSALLRDGINSEFDTVNLLINAPRVWIPDDLLELAGLGQHYGLPTRLLDWSFDPYIACYFVAMPSKKPKQSVEGGFLTVWALNHDYLAYLRYSVAGPYVKFVVPPYAGNPNLAAQQGVFTHWPEQSHTPIDAMRGGFKNL